jgi:hypothetical protein
MPAIEMRGTPEGEHITADPKDSLARQWKDRWQDQYEQVTLTVFAAPEAAMAIDRRLDTLPYGFDDLLDDVDAYNDLRRRTIQATLIPPYGRAQGNKAPQALQEAYKIWEYQSLLEEQAPEVRARRIAQFEREHKQFCSPDQWEAYKAAEIEKTDAQEQRRIARCKEKLLAWGYQL